MRSNIFDNTSPPQPSRFVLPLKTDFNNGENMITLRNTKATAFKHENGDIFVTRDFLCSPGFELPTVNSKKFGKKYQYVYGSGVFERTSYRNSAIKLDVQTKEITQWHGTDSMYPGELTFVQNPGKEAEDDGILLTVVIDVGADKPDFLLVLDAKTMKEIARAEINSEVRVPFTLHNLFVPKNTYGM